MTHEFENTKLSRLLLDISGLAGKVYDYSADDVEMRCLNVKCIKRMLGNIKTALLERGNHVQELNWLDNEVPAILDALDKCLNPRLTKGLLGKYSFFAADKLRELQEMVRKIDEGYSY